SVNVIRVLVSSRIHDCASSGYAWPSQSTPTSVSYACATMNCSAAFVGFPTEPALIGSGVATAIESTGLASDATMAQDDRGADTAGRDGVAHPLRMASAAHESASL